MPRALWETDEEGIAARHPMRRIGAPDDIAGAALYLASDTASWLTGALLVIDGGLSLVLAAGRLELDALFGRVHDGLRLRSDQVVEVLDDLAVQVVPEHLS